MVSRTEEFIGIAGQLKIGVLVLKTGIVWIIFLPYISPNHLVSVGNRNCRNSRNLFWFSKLIFSWSKSSHFKESWKMDRLAAKNFKICIANAKNIKNYKFFDPFSNFLESGSTYFKKNRLWKSKQISVKIFLINWFLEILKSKMKTPVMSNMCKLFIFIWCWMFWQSKVK